MGIVYRRVFSRGSLRSLARRDLCPWKIHFAFQFRRGRNIRRETRNRFALRERERERGSAPPRAKPRKRRIADGFGHGLALKPPVRLRCFSAAAPALRTLHFRPGSIATRRKSSVLAGFPTRGPGTNKIVRVYQFSLGLRRSSDPDDQSRSSLEDTLPSFK